MAAPSADAVFQRALGKLYNLYFYLKCIYIHAIDVWNSGAKDLSRFINTGDF